MIYAKNDALKKIMEETMPHTPEVLMKKAGEIGISFGYFFHDKDDSIFLILNNDLIYLDEDAEIIEAKGNYAKFKDPLSSVTELENKMQKDINVIMGGNLDVLCLGTV